MAWFACAPLGFALATGSAAEAAFAGAVAGVVASASSVARREFRALLALTMVPTGIAGALASALGSRVVAQLGAPVLVFVLPLVTVAMFLPLRWMGAPRWVANPIACTQERRLTIVHTARLGGDYVTTAILALSSSMAVLGTKAWLDGRAAPQMITAAVVAAVLLAATITFGALSRRRAILRQRDGVCVRVAAVVVDGPLPEGDLTGLWPVESPHHRDVEGTVSRYDPFIRQAASHGAELIVLPEVAVNVDAHGRAQWNDAVTTWARSLEVVIVAPWFDRNAPANTLTVVDVRGDTSTYDKQHPARGMEPARRARTSPGPRLVATRSRIVPLSTVICVDLDYGDLVGAVRADGGVLAAPSNDWFGGFEIMHHETAVWAAVLTGVTTIRATGHGVSAVYDGAGRVLARQSSAEGPVVLVVDAPLAQD